ncbi:hypothetical protein RDV64_09725 [Acuticoccus sp. MNP-M23]|uniref:hypothetical protein n=1 Tax=Acuticoccus sp. MNP-M23 TaxID=3072793 RepID=UPI002814B620|nr:hypothetical protein [Acuticoccus sp. MNP-M23]WMS44633.1 hypothetical protein RDV64_09725 [Acuticoccus sp. MNP-M23]
MAVEFQAPRMGEPLRVIFLGASTSGWFDATGEARRNEILPRMKALFAEWEEMGAKCLATVDDDLFMVGQPGSPDFTWYLIMDVPSAETVAAMINLVRKDRDGMRLDQVMRLEAKLGRPFFLLEP